MRSIQFGDIKLMTCFGQTRIEAAPDIRHYLGLPGGVDRIRSAEEVLEALNCHIEGKVPISWSAELVKVNFDKDCELNTRTWR